MDINLLPQELKPKSYAIKLSRALRKIAVITLSTFLILIIFVIGAYTVLSLRLRDSSSRQDRLRTEIRALEQTEQKLVLVQDRVGKVSSVLSSGDSREEAEILKEVISKLPAEVVLEEVNLTSDKANLTVFTTSSLFLTRFFAEIINSGYKSVELVAFSYRDTTGGYKVELGIVR